MPVISVIVPTSLAFGVLCSTKRNNTCMNSRKVAGTEPCPCPITHPTTTQVAA
jgi:hypothetical protein